MKTKILLWSVISVLSTGIAGEPSASDQPQVIQLDTGVKLKLLGTSFGRGNHRPPGFGPNSGFDPLFCPDDSYVVWIENEHQGKQRPIYQLLVYDRARTACVPTGLIMNSHMRYLKDGVDIFGFVLEAYPRWDKEVILRAKEYGRDKSIADGQFVITNSHPVSTAPAWTPEPLPVTKSDGDLEVRLTQFETGAPFPYRQGSDPARANDVENRCVHLNFEYRQNGQPTTNWGFWSVRTSDATGNRVRGFISGYPKNGIYPIYPDRMHPTFPLVYDGYYYEPGLWPDKSPWKVQLEFTRRSGFSPEETVTFTKVPVRPGTQQDLENEWTWDESNTNFAFVAEGTVNGVKLKLLPPLLVPAPDTRTPRRVSVVIYADPGPVAQRPNLTVVEATDEQGRPVAAAISHSPWSEHFSLDFPRDRDDIKTLNLKLALHKSRFVEFTVKPTRE